MGAGMARPQLAVVVDTEEEFDWTRPFSRANRSVRSVPAQALAQAIYDPLGIVPTYVVDHPVATDPSASAFLARLRDEGRAEIGAHLHPWVTPPDEEEVTAFNSYHCNLPPALERAKIERLTAAIEAGFGERPRVFKAGRYGFGEQTRRTLVDLGYEVDCSIVPHTSFGADGGPDFRGSPDRPWWLDRSAGLLEVPLTAGFIGRFAGWGPRTARLFDDPLAGRLRVPGLLARLGLERSRLSPEGVSADEQCRLIAAMAERGASFFTLAYHSPSLEPGHTPYVRGAADLEAFLDSIRRVLTFFLTELGGEFTTLTRYRAGLLAPSEAGAPGG